MKAVFSLFVFIFLFSTSNANAQWMSSNNGCYAYTDCYAPSAYGPIYTRTISCQTFGSTYAYGPSYSSQACQWQTIPNQAVFCNGYAQVTNAYGQTVWGWQSFSARCY